MEEKLQPAMRSNTYLTLAWQFSLSLALCVAAVGCAPSESPSRMTCRVLIDGVPALEVRVVLLRIDQGAYTPVLDGIADSSGSIALKQIDGAELPSEETELVAMIEAIGGDWQLNAPWSDPKKTPLKVKWPATSPQIEIAIPKKAIRSI